MSRILKLLTIVLLSSCCTGKIQQIQNPITEREYQILGKNCDYVFEKCKNRNNDYEIVNLLKYTECFNGLASDEMISILGSPTEFHPSSELNPFIIYGLGRNEEDTYFYQAKYLLRNDTIISGNVSKIKVYKN